MNEDNIKLNQLEERVFRDIVQARYSYALISMFIMPLLQKSTPHFRNKHIGLTQAIWGAAIDSSITALGRLLQPNPDEGECTLSKYRNMVCEKLKKSTPILNQSIFYPQ